MNMEENITRLDYQGKEIILVATAHVSKQSAELVKRIIDEEHPDSICVELDEGRYQSLQNPKAWENTDIVQIIKSRKVGFLLANLILSSYQKRIASDLNTAVGQEMLQGIASAKETGAQLVLADRNIQVTFLRIWRKLGNWEKCKLLFSLLFSFSNSKKTTVNDVNEILKKDNLDSLVGEMYQQFPSIAKVLIDERDQYLAYKIKGATGKKVVAVLGAAHVPGVKEEIFKTQDIAGITRVPPGSPIFKYIGWAVPIIIIGLIIYGFTINTQIGWQQISAWVLWTSIPAAVFTALALGHPLSILTSLVTAPLTALHPMLACGWFAGLVEAAIRKPTVRDINNIPGDIFRIKGILKNRFLKVLLIVIMANIGCSLGVFIAGLDIVKSIL
jgi:pheromone shutdown-related protein TraB